MSKKSFLFISIFLFTILIFSGCTKQAQLDENNQVMNEPQQKDDQKDIFKGNLKGLVGLGKKVKCTWSGEKGESGVVYTDGKRSRFEGHNLDSLMPEEAGAEAMNSLNSMYTIDDGEYIYTWSDNSKKGMKLASEDPTDEETQENEMNETDEKYNPAMDYDYQYKCENWNIDEKMFVPPSDIVFDDLNKMMGQTKSDMSAVCNMLQGEAKEECLGSLSK